MGAGSVGPDQPGSRAGSRAGDRPGPAWPDRAGAGPAKAWGGSRARGWGLGHQKMAAMDTCDAPMFSSFPDARDCLLRLLLLLTPCRPQVRRRWCKTGEGSDDDAEVAEAAFADASIAARGDGYPPEAWGPLAAGLRVVSGRRAAA